MSTSNLHPPAPTGIPPRPGAPGEEFFARIRALGIVRPDQGRWGAGVAAGLAHRWGVDPLLVRGAFVALGLLGGSGFALYGLCWLFLPHPDGRIHAQGVLSGRVTAGFIGALVIVLLNVGDLFRDQGPFFWHPFGGVLPLVVIGLIAWWFVAKRGALGSATGSAFEPGPEPGYGSSAASQPFSSTATASAPWPATAPFPPVAPSAPSWAVPGAGSVATRPHDSTTPLHSLTFGTLGFAVLAGVAAGALRFWSTSSTTTAWLVGAAVALGVVALGLVVAGLAGRRGGGLAPIAILLAIVCVNGLFWRGPIATFGNHQWKPGTVAAIDQGGLNQGGGDVVLDLTEPTLVAGATAATPVTVPLKVGVGHVKIVVPATVNVVVNARVGLGEIDDRIGNRTDSGGGNTMTVTSGRGDPVLVVNADLGVGQLEVTR